MTEPARERYNVKVIDRRRVVHLWRFDRLRDAERHFNQRVREARATIAYGRRSYPRARTVRVELNEWMGRCGEWHRQTRLVAVPAFYV